jgi:hypothetical protein
MKYSDLRELPDTRHLVKEGDSIHGLWFPEYTWFSGIVKKDVEGLYIQCHENSVGYLHNAHHIVKTLMVIR